MGCYEAKIIELTLELDKVKRDNDVLREHNRKLLQKLQDKETKEHEDLRATRPIAVTNLAEVGRFE
jgi:CHAD domain-containing protein